MLEVRVLGPLEVRVNGVALSLGTRKQQTVLAMLAVHSGRVVTLEELIDELWPEDPPASAVANARTYAANLRRLFDSAEPTRDLIVRRGAGYLLQVDPAAVDLHAFEADCRRAREAHAVGDAAEAVAMFATAEARWRGPMLAGVPRGPVLTARCSAVEQERLELTEERAELHLSLAHPAEAARLLRDHVQMHPLRERAHALLMRALSEAGDVAGALSAYRTARTTLVDQLGIEPGLELRRLHQAVLNRTSADESPPLAAPRCWLPRRVADFTGRADLVARTVDAAKRSDDSPVIQLIDGMAGSGKTTLAVHVAHYLTKQYPDAQLFIDLQGHSESSPLEPATALVTLLRQLGVSGGRIPADVDGRVAMWRTELAARRAVVVLDNAASTDQVSPLLPVSPGCVFLVTSRRRLMALDGAHPESLPVLSPPEAMELLAKVVGPDRVKGEPESAADVVHRCGYLPLAIRLAGARLAHRPGWHMADLAGRLRHGSPLLAELAAENRTIASAFALSYDPLSEPRKRMLRFLALWPGEHFGTIAAAALSGMSLSDAELVITELVDRHLVDESDAGRFRLHDLMREYAHSLALISEAPTDRQCAIESVLDCYVHAAAVATEHLESNEARAHIALQGPSRPDLLAALAPVDVAWLETERTNVRALVRCAAEVGQYKYAWQLARLTWRFHFIRGYYDDIADTHQHGLYAADRANDIVGTASMHNYIASAWHRLGRHQEAVDHLGIAINLREGIGDEYGASISRSNIGAVYLWQGKLSEAVEILERALIGWPHVAGGPHAGVLANLGLSLTSLGRYKEALRIHRFHLSVGRERKDYFHIGQALAHIGAARIGLGDHHQAIRLIEASLAIKRRTGNRFAESDAINDLGVAHRRLGLFDEAERRHRSALKIARISGERQVESVILNDLGLTLAAGGKREAVEMHHEALVVATKISHPYEQARALAGIAACIEADDPAEARRHWERALAIYRKMGVPERIDVERRLDELDR